MSCRSSYSTVYKGFPESLCTTPSQSIRFSIVKFIIHITSKTSYKMFKTLLPLALGACLISATAASPLDTRQASPTSKNPFPPSPPFAASSSEIKAIQEALILAPSEVDRENILFTNTPDATNITFQFVNVTHSAPTGGEIILSSVDNFPALIGTHGNLPIYLLLPPTFSVVG